MHAVRESARTVLQGLDCISGSPGPARSSALERGLFPEILREPGSCFQSVRRAALLSSMRSASPSEYHAPASRCRRSTRQGPTVCGNGLFVFFWSKKNITPQPLRAARYEPRGNSTPARPACERRPQGRPGDTLSATCRSRLPVRGVRVHGGDGRESPFRRKRISEGQLALGQEEEGVARKARLRIADEHLPVQVFRGRKAARPVLRAGKAVCRLRNEGCVTSRCGGPAVTGRPPGNPCPALPGQHRGEARHAAHRVLLPAIRRPAPQSHSGGSPLFHSFRA